MLLGEEGQILLPRCMGAGAGCCEWSSYLQRSVRGVSGWPCPPSPLPPFLARGTVLLRGIGVEAAGSCAVTFAACSNGCDPAPPPCLAASKRWGKRLVPRVNIFPGMHQGAAGCTLAPREPALALRSMRFATVSCYLSSFHLPLS